MVKQVGDKCIFEAKWSDTVEGAVHKYPNDYSTNIASVDVLERCIDEDGNLVSKKMLRTIFNPNPVMKSVMSILKMPARTHQTSLELNKLDLGRKYFQLKSLNKTYFNSIRCFEVLEYTPDLENPTSQTELNQYALIDMYANRTNFAIRWAVHKGESVFAQHYINNSKNNRQGLKDVIQNLQLEWADLAKGVAKDLAKDAEKIGQEILDKTTEIASEIASEGAKVGVRVGQEIRPIVDKTVEVVDITVDKTVEIGKVVEKVLHQEERTVRGDN